MSEERKPGGFATDRKVIIAARELVRGGVPLAEASVLTLFFDAEAMLATIDALVADNAALTQVLRESLNGMDPRDADCAREVLAKEHPGSAVWERLRRLEDFARLFESIAEDAIRHHEWKAAGSKGMRVSFCGEFANAPTSVISDLRRLAKQAREALKP